MSSEKIFIALQKLEAQVHDLLIQKKEWLTAKEVSDEFKLSMGFLYQQTSLKRIPHYKPNGKLIYFKRSEIEQWIVQSRVKTITELEAEAFSTGTEPGRYGK